MFADLNCDNNKKNPKWYYQSGTLEQKTTIVNKMQALLKI